MKRPANRQAPRAIKRSSYNVMEVIDENVQPVLGPREETVTGYKADANNTASFETYVECLAPGASTPTYLHASKERMVRVLNGVLTMSKAIDNTSFEVNMNRGATAIAEAHIMYRFSNMTASPVEYLVIQAPKYEARLEVKDPAIAVNVNGDLLIAHVPVAGRSHASKASKQLKTQRRAAGKETDAPTVSGRIAVEGINAKPMNMADME